MTPDGDFKDRIAESKARFDAHLLSQAEVQRRLAADRTAAEELIAANRERKHALQSLLATKMRQDARDIAPSLPFELAHSRDTLIIRKYVPRRGLKARLTRPEEFIDVEDPNPRALWLVSVRYLITRSWGESFNRGDGSESDYRAVAITNEGDLLATTVTRQGSPNQYFNWKPYDRIREAMPSFIARANDDDLLPFESTELHDMEGDEPRVIVEWRRTLLSLIDPASY